jgi:predicted alpha/beta superfamily hydrolase
MKSGWILVFTFVFSFTFAQTLPKVSSGNIKRIENFSSQFIASRNVDVWLPEGYNSTKKYNVVYMHDGQMLFDSLVTWNKKEWKVDEVFSKLIKDKTIDECIVVGIWNNGSERISEYFPNKIFDQLLESTRKKISEKYCNGKTANGDNYLKFVVTELKPYIDRNFSTRSEKAHTFMIGSSMGGLISIYALSEYPTVFEGVACMSTAWLSFIEPNYEVPAAAFDYLKKNLPSALDHKIYFDYGTGESDRNYELTQSFVDLIAKGRGYTDKNYMSKVFEKDEHNEVSWSKRLKNPVEFLMQK